MDCAELAKALAWHCQRVETNYAPEAFRLLPPVRMWDGTLVPLYVFQHGGTVELSDDGATLFHLDVAGFDVSCDQRKWRGLERAFDRWGVSFGSDGALHVLCKPTELRGALMRYLGAMFALSQWQHEHAGRPLGSEQLIFEVEHYLRVLHPDSVFSRDVDLVGISGRTLRFPLSYDQTLVDSLVPHHVATNALISKLVDVQALVENSNTAITVVVDDRGDAERVRGDIQVLTQLAHPVRLTALEAEARKRLHSH